MCEGLEKLRKTLWSILGELYNQEKYKNSINKILLKYNPYSNNEKQRDLIYKMDFKYIKEYILTQIISPDFTQCRILKHFDSISQVLNVSKDNILGKYKENEEYLIIHTLKHERDLGENWEKAEEERRKRVRDMVKNYSITDFSKLFSICSNVEKYEKGLNNYNLTTSILDIFDYILEEKEEYFLKIFEEYINYNAPFLSYPDFLISKILNKYSYEDVLKILMSSTDDKKYCYLKGYYKNINII